MASNLLSKTTGLLIGVVALSATTSATIASIRSNTAPAAVQRALVTTGDQYIVTGDDSTPSVYLDDDSAVKTWPTLPGTEHCEGNTGALLCHVMIKLTGSGGHRNHNAGSFACQTSTCSIVSARVFTESGADHLYGGWTNTPGAASGSQLFNHKLTKNGFTLIGSGSRVINGPDGATIRDTPQDVPPGSTVKFTWKVGNGTEDYSRTKAAALIDYYKYYNP